MQSPTRIETRIRPMIETDLSQVLDIDQRSFSLPWPENAFRFELLENPNSYCWVADADGCLVGHLVCWLIVDEIHIATLAVDPDFRGQGISKELVAAGLIALIPKDAVLATLEVRAGNLAAQNLYRYFGFEIVGRRLRYYRDNGEDALLMTVSGLGPAYLAWMQAGMPEPWPVKAASS